MFGRLKPLHLLFRGADAYLLVFRRLPQTGVCPEKAMAAFHRQEKMLIYGE